MTRVHLALIAGIVGAALVASSVAFAMTRPASKAAAFSACHATSTLICLTQAASSHTTTVKKGQVVEVTLSGTTLQWSKPEVVGEQLLRPVGSALQRGGDSRARFSAIRTGTTAIQASATAKCSPGQACPQFALLWRAAIVVRN